MAYDTELKISLTESKYKSMLGHFDKNIECGSKDAHV